MTDGRGKGADLDFAIVRKVFTRGASALILFVLACGPAQVAHSANPPGITMLHATITVSGGVSFTASFDHGMRVPTCADVAKSGTIPPDTPRGSIFEIPVPNTNRTGNASSVGGGHTYATDAFAWPYHGPGSYTGKSLHGTSLSADPPSGSTELHIFGYPTDVGTLIVNPDGSGSFQFVGLQDAAKVTISGKITWTCS
ncbi:MAG: hypothetical protein ABSF53_17175 [Terracidiphilus sp.]